jgi:hypothetical protein
VIEQRQPLLATHFLVCAIAAPDGGQLNGIRAAVCAAPDYASSGYGDHSSGSVVNSSG